MLSSSSSTSEKTGTSVAQRRTQGIPWVEKYRPKEMDRIVQHEVICRIMREFIRTCNCLPHLFLYGPPGTGKTSTIMSCAYELYGKAASMMVLHLNASDERGVDVVRKQIIQFASTRNMFQPNDREKLVVLD